MKIELEEAQEKLDEVLEVQYRVVYLFFCTASCTIYRFEPFCSFVCSLLMYTDVELYFCMLHAVTCNNIYNRHVTKANVANCSKL